MAHTYVFEGSDYRFGIDFVFGRPVQLESAVIVSPEQPSDALITSLSQGFIKVGD